MPVDMHLDCFSTMVLDLKYFCMMCTTLQRSSPIAKHEPCFKKDQAWITCFPVQTACALQLARIKLVFPAAL